MFNNNKNNNNKNLLSLTLWWQAIERLSRAQKILLMNINCIIIIITLEGIEETKQRKMTAKQFE